MLRSHNNLQMKWHTRSYMSVRRRNGQQTWILTWLCPRFYTRGKWKNANNTAWLHRIVSGVLSMGLWVKVRLSSVGLSWAPLNMGSIGGFVLEWYPCRKGTRNDPYLHNNPTQALYSQTSGLGPKYAYIHM